MEFSTVHLAVGAAEGGVNANDLRKKFQT